MNAFQGRFVTSTIAGTNGVLKQRPEDFLVDEQPLYQPAGAGEHIYLLVQKREMPTPQMLRIIARHFGVEVKQVGYAGLKDKHAITRQVVSVHAPTKKIEDFPMLEHDRVAILWSDYHSNKLRPGHLRGNRFSIKIRGVAPTDVRLAWATLNTLQKVGAPNRIGTQRFGMLANNHRIGQALIAGDEMAGVREMLGPCATRPDFNTEARELFAQGKFAEAIEQYPVQATIETRVLRSLAQGRSPRQALRALDETTLRFFLSAFQSAVFNRVLDARIADASFATLREGDLAMKHDNGAVFAIDSPTLHLDDTRARLDALAISPTGPMWASGMMRAAADVDSLEVQCLEQEGVTLDQLAAFDDSARRLRLEGKRRALRVPLIDPEVEGGVDEHGAYIRCAFELPRGAFATEVMREVMKPKERSLAADPAHLDHDEGS
jgi:tRNA pseudouridine13 synthase